MTTLTAEQVLAAIQELKIENDTLKAKKAKRERPKISLQNLTNPDPAFFVTADQVADMCVSEGLLPKASKSDGYFLLKLFGLKALAQTKAEDAKGSGKRLYMTGDILDAIKLVKSFPGR
jgi:hypothetical protein